MNSASRQEQTIGLLPRALRTAATGQHRTRFFASRSHQWAGLHKEQVRKYIAPLNHAEAPPISSLRYFTSLRSEVSELLVSDDYWVPADSKVTAPSIRESCHLILGGVMLDP